VNSKKIKGSRGKLVTRFSGQLFDVLIDPRIRLIRLFLLVRITEARRRKEVKKGFDRRKEGEAAVGDRRISVRRSFNHVILNLVNKMNRPD